MIIFNHAPPSQFLPYSPSPLHSPNFEFSSGFVIVVSIPLPLGLVCVTQRLWGVQSAPKRGHVEVTPAGSMLKVLLPHFLFEMGKLCVHRTCPSP